MAEAYRMSDEELEYYSRHIVLRDIGYVGQAKLRKASVAVVGIGGLGCPIATQLVAMGVGKVRLIDRDVVEYSNLHRQHLYDVESIGRPKVEVAAEKLSKLNPTVEIEPVAASLHVDNAEELLSGVDLVVDGLDNPEARYAVNRACVKLGIPYVFGAAIEMSGNLMTMLPGETPCLECFLPNLKNEDLPACGVVGVHPSLLGVISSLEVAEAVRVILGTPRLAGRLLFVDLRQMAFETVDVYKRDNCPVCAEGPPSPLERRLVEEICGRKGRRTFVINPRKKLPIDLAKLAEAMERLGAAVKAKSPLGVTAQADDALFSCVASGSAVIEGARDEGHALALYRKLVVEPLGISWSDVE